MAQKWTRRRFLQAAGISASVSAFAPLFPLPTAEAQDGAPKRLVLITTALGTDMARWSPTGSESDFTLSEQLAPLQAHKERLLILDGVDIAVPYVVEPAFGGHFASSSLWTGMPVLPGGSLTINNLRWPQGPSVDRLIAEHVGTETSFDAYHWGTWRTSRAVRYNTPDLIAHFHGADQPVTTQYDPAAVFDQMFGSVTGDSAEVERIRQRRASVLDTVRGSIGRLRGELPTGDRALLDAHLEQIRSVERRLGELQPSCMPPERPEERAESFLRSDGNHQLLSQLHFEMMSNALACDLTRVACFHWYVSDYVPTWRPADGRALHADSHALGRPDGREAMNRNQTWHAQSLSDDLLTRLPEAVADNMTLVWASHMSEGLIHSNRNVPIVIYQGANLDYFKTNTYLRFGDGFNVEDPHAYSGSPPHNKLLTSLCHSMGLMSVDHVGDPAVPDHGPLTEAMR